MFALAAGADAYGREIGWNEPLARLYYATGPALVVAFLAIGELYLLFPQKMGRFAPGAAILLTATWMTLVLDAPIDGGGLRVMAITINAAGTVIIVGGLLWSVWRFRRSGTHRNRMIGCTLIVVGTLSVAMGGTLTRLGHYEYLYIAMSFGIALIFGGVICTRRQDIAESGGGVGEITVHAPGDARVDAQVQAPAVSAVGITPELTFLAEKVLPLTGDALRDSCRSWSVELDDDSIMSRRDARQAWRLRKHLSPEGQDRFDAMTVPERRAVVQLAAEVLQVPVLSRIDDPAPARGESAKLGD